MTTQTIETTIGNIPSPYNWAVPTAKATPEILFLEKATDGRVTLESFDINNSQELVEAISEEVSKLFTEAECPTEEQEVI